MAPADPPPSSARAARGSMCRKPTARMSVQAVLATTASNLTVVIPDDVPVQIRADMTMGNLNEGSQNHGGMTNQRSYYNTDKPGETLIVEIDGTFSNVTIREGN